MSNLDDGTPDTARARAAPAAHGAHSADAVTAIGQLTAMVELWEFEPQTSCMPCPARVSKMGAHLAKYPASLRTRVAAVRAEDRIIPRNPCRIRGAGDENPAERPVLTIEQVYDRFRALVLLVTFASLRWGEAIALRRCDIDLETCTVVIRRQYVELSGQLIVGLHFHDLRHTGNMLAAPGTSLADLKARMGHDSARAALIYQHATAQADQAIAAAIDKRITGSRAGRRPTRRES